MSMVIADTLATEMARDDRIFVIGEDVGGMGGVFGATRHLLQRFGDQRVLDAPISESAFVGLAVGSAQAGLRPVVELMFIDFIGVCFDQIYNQMAKAHYMSDGAVEVPLVLRAAVGCIGAAAQHSQTLSGLIAHVPGLKVAFPSNPLEAAGMLRGALADPNPVVFLEHKLLLKTRSERLPYEGQETADAQAIPLGRAAIARDGADLTIAATGWCVQQAILAAERLGELGIDAEVIDLRTLVPLDRDALLKSVAKTKRLVVVDEDYVSFGVSGELIAIVSEELWDQHPRVARVALPDVPIPASHPLEEAVLPSADAIFEASHRLMEASS